MNKIKKVFAIALSTVTIAGVCVCGGGGVSAGASGTGAGLAEHALNAYYEGWDYVWGGTEPGGVDCTGLIWMYCGGSRVELLADAKANGREWGYVSNGIPRVHGLGLSRPNHAGVYIEDGMEVDARGSEWGVRYQAIGENGYNNWDCWFKLTAVSYPDTGWESFNGNYYYYENGEYIVSTSRTIDGTTYYFDSKGHSSTTPSNTSSSSGSSSSKSSGSSSTSTKSKPTSWKKGSSDDEVIKIQNRLAELGYYDGGIDGVFGDKTDEAFRAFQKNAGLTVDGIAGTDRLILYSDNAPYAKKEEEEKPVASQTEEVEQTEETTEPETEQTEETVPTVEDTDDSDDSDDSDDDYENTLLVVQLGDFSDSVATVQSKLIELGYFSLEATGYFGDNTTDAITSFQLANGIDATGLMDANTYEILFSDDAVEATKPEEEAVGEEVATEEIVEEGSDEMIGDVTGEVIEESAGDIVVEDVVEEATEDAKAVLSTEESTSVAEAENARNRQYSLIGKTNSEFAAAASRTAAQANEVTAKALEKSSNIVPSANTAEVKRTPNVWIWMLLAAAVLGIAAFIILMYSRKHSKASSKASKKKSSTKAQLNTRW